VLIIGPGAAVDSRTGPRREGTPWNDTRKSGRDICVRLPTTNNAESASQGDTVYFKKGDECTTARPCGGKAGLVAQDAVWHSGLPYSL
jgi:hypothetical protein